MTEEAQSSDLALISLLLSCGLTLQTQDRYWVFDMGLVSFVFTDDDYDTRLVQQVSPSSFQPLQIGAECVPDRESGTSWCTEGGSPN